MSWLDSVFPIVALALSVAILILSEWLSRTIRQDEVATESREDDARRHLSLVLLDSALRTGKRRAMGRSTNCGPSENRLKIARRHF
jgi:hypothetical protein